jgi:taurine transport system substrate-binding protein
MTIKRALSNPIVTVCVSALISFSAHASNLTVRYQTGIDPSKVPQADVLYEQTIGQNIDWRRCNSGPEAVTAIASADVPELLAGSAFPDAKAQQTTARL